MSGSSFGKNFRVTTWGESHGPAMGAIVDGCPAGLELSVEWIQSDLDRRRPGRSPYSTPRQESDQLEILSGVFQGRTTGAPVSIVVANRNAHSKDYDQLATVWRPGHADAVYEQKYGRRDFRGGGRSSGRETVGRVAAGSVARRFLQEIGITVTAYTSAIGPIQIDPSRTDLAECVQNPFYMPDRLAAAQAEEYVQALKAEGDSSGGIVECRVTGLPAGVGEPVFDKMDALLAQAIVSIGAVKAIEFGAGFRAASSTGSENNDCYYVTDQGQIAKRSNNSGGVLGGISEGYPLVLRAYFKPTPSISKLQETVTNCGEPYSLSVQGRHDPLIVPRAVVVVEAMTALVLADLLLQRLLSNMELVKKAFSN